MAERILNIAAKTENLDQVLGFIDSFLEEQECDMKAMIQIDVAVEEMVYIMTLLQRRIPTLLWEPRSGLSADLGSLW